MLASNSRQDTDGRHKDEVGNVADSNMQKFKQRHKYKYTDGRHQDEKRKVISRDGLRDSLRICFDEPMTDTRKILH